MLSSPNPERISGYDLARALAILLVFLGHAVTGRFDSPWVIMPFRTVSPWITMSVLGFVSAALISPRESADDASLARRLLRIYVPLFLCLGPVLVMYALMGRNVVTQHTLLHLMGLTGLFDLLDVNNVSPIGATLWFITVIVALYLLLPVLRRLFLHRNGLWHLMIVIVIVSGLNSAMYGTQSIWVVVIAFCTGCYLALNRKLAGVLALRPAYALAGTVALVGLTYLYVAGYMPRIVLTLVSAAYSICLLPLIFRLAALLPSSMLGAVAYFATISYEVYLLHSNFISDGFWLHFGIQPRPVVVILGGGAITLVLAALINPLAVWLNRKAVNYLMK